MSPSRKYSPPPPVMMDPTLCHYCNKNKLDPKDRYFLPSGIEVCKECAARHGKGTMSPEQRTTQKLLEEIARNKETRKRRQKAEPRSKKPLTGV